MPGRGIVHQDYQSHSDTLHTSWENLPSSNMLSKIGHFRYICLCVYCTHMYTQYILYIYISMDIALLRRAKQTHFDPQTHNIFFRMIALIVYWAWSSTEFDTQWHPFAIPLLTPCRQTPAAKQLLASDVFGCVTTVKSADQCEAKMKKIHSRSITEDHPRSPARRCP